MTTKKTMFLTLVLLGMTVIVTRCYNSPDKETRVSVITPKELPVIVPGFHFPEDSTVIYGWMNDKKFAPNNYDSASIYSHAWGIWAGLTAFSGEIYQGDSLLIYETWLGISDISDIITAGNNPDGGCVGKTKSTRLSLSKPHQFQHGFNAMSAQNMKMANNKGTGIDTSANSAHSSFWVTVSYDPNAACYATQNSILKQSVLNKYAVNNGIGNIPSFPTKSMTVKPTYYVGKKTDDLIRIFVWSGPPNPAQAYPDTTWPTVVYADVHNKQVANKHLVPVSVNSKDKKAMDSATCNLSDFISFKLDSAMAKYMNHQDSLNQGINAEAGDIAILMAMHVTTKEISNWTWQTFYWAPDPAHPFFPSSDMAASLRPKQLQGAASHYATATGYCMVLPNQPITGGTNSGKTPMFGWNPYLEAGFSGLAPSPLIPNSQFGVQTNCMSCHMMATSDGSLNYNTAQYISTADPMFINKIRIDFAWSIQGNMIKDVSAAKKEK